MPPSPGHFWANSVTAAPCGQKYNARASSHNQSVTGPEDEIAGIRFRLATATTKRSTRSRRPKTRSRPGFFLPTASGRTSGTFFYQVSGVHSNDKIGAPLTLPACFAIFGFNLAIPYR